MCTEGGGNGDAGAVVLCETGRARYAEAIEQGGIAPERAPRCLLELGLLQPDAEGELVAVAPRTAAVLRLGPLRHQVQRHLESIASAEGEYLTAERIYDAAQRDAGSEIRLIRGAEIISAVLQAAVDGCRGELLTVQPGGGRPYELLERALEREVPALQRGIKQLTIYQHSVRAHGPTVDYVARVTAAGAAIRTTDEVIDRMIIIDREVAFIPTALPRGQEALEIRQPAIVRFLGRLFENVWARALPWDGSVTAAKPEAVASETQQAIIRMLVMGWTQSRIARELGMSLRTLTTHVSRLSNELGSASPIQLGYLIAAKGLYDPDSGGRNPAGIEIAPSEPSPPEPFHP